MPPASVGKSDSIMKFSRQVGLFEGLESIGFGRAHSAAPRPIRCLVILLVLAGCTGEDRDVSIPGDVPESIPGSDVPAATGEPAAPEQTMEAYEIESIGLEMIRVSAGVFVMGSPEEEFGRRNEEVEHSVTLTRDFYVAKTEVSQAQWTKLMPTNPSVFKGDDLPVEGVDWYSAVKFCNRLSQSHGIPPAYDIADEGVSWDATGTGYRLPTEAEWEYVARAGTSTAFYSGDGPPSSFDDGTDGPLDSLSVKTIMRFEENIGSPLSAPAISPLPVGTRGPNPWGLYETHGNVGEWCWDWAAPYPPGEMVDPIGPLWALTRVIRGWPISPALYRVRSATRGKSPPEGGRLVGLRPVRFVEELTLGRGTGGMSVSPFSEEKLNCVSIFMSLRECGEVAMDMVLHEWVEAARAAGESEKQASPSQESDDEARRLLTRKLEAFLGSSDEEFEALVGIRCDHFSVHRMETVDESMEDLQESIFVALEAAQACRDLPCQERVACIQPFFGEMFPYFTVVMDPDRPKVRSSNDVRELKRRQREATSGD